MAGLLDPVQAHQPEPNTRTHSRHVNENEHEPGPSARYAKRQKINQLELCNVCVYLDFTAMFNGTLSSEDIQPLPPLLQMLQNTHCKLCQFIVQMARDALALPYSLSSLAFHHCTKRIISSSDGHADFDVQCSFTSDWAPKTLYLRPRSVESHRQIRVKLHGPGHVGYKRRRNSSRWHIGSIESTTHFHVANTEVGLYAMLRQPISDSFRGETLLEWLRDSNFDLGGSASKPNQILPRLSLSSLRNCGHLRLFDVHSAQIVSPAQDVPYVALSYVWGRVMTEYVEGRKTGQTNGCSMSELPRTVRHAAALVAAIGERFLWVDALCIEQGDALDTHANISQMGAIYDNALLTIVATEGHGADAGLSRLQPGASHAETPLVLDTVHGRQSILKARNPMDEIVALSGWATRGWTMQERLLSRRCVYFTSHEVLFYSPGLEAREAYVLVPSDANDATTTSPRQDHYTRLPRLHDVVLRPEAVTFAQYSDIVQEFTSRHLRYETDRLAAFTGILSRLHDSKTSPDVIAALAGLPEKHFAKALLWFHVVGKDPPERNRVDTQHTRALPSWSWAGWTGPCVYSPDDDVAPDGPDVAVLDSENIMCYTTPHYAIDAEPTVPRSETSQPRRTILHLWAKAIECKIPRWDDKSLQIDLAIPNTPPNAELHFTSLTFRRWELGNIPSPPPGAELLVLIVNTQERTERLKFVGMLVERQGQYFERLALLNTLLDPGRSRSDAFRLIDERCHPQWISLQ